MSTVSVNKSISVKSSTSAFVDVCEQVLSYLKADDFSEEDIFAVHLALEEAFVNAVKHGNKMDSDKEVMIDYSVDSEKVEIFVTDQGCGFDPETVPDPRCAENLYKTGGRGLFLIRSFMDAVDFNKRGNQLYMIRNKTGKAKGNSKSELE